QLIQIESTLTSPDNRYLLLVYLLDEPFAIPTSSNILSPIDVKMKLSLIALIAAAAPAILAAPAPEAEPGAPAKYGDHYPPKGGYGRYGDKGGKHKGKGDDDDDDDKYDDKYGYPSKGGDKGHYNKDRRGNDYGGYGDDKGKGHGGYGDDKSKGHGGHGDDKSKGHGGDDKGHGKDHWKDHDKGYGKGY
ncbi:hypothetical protein BGZ61DRAFT_570515, partial [Ilyonectria robusta]|uniref:uncharacterized protein n=1 Tax=Ilyonectria robusta TaxID=1079257 RepID=UPI001E8E4708